jgi:ribosome-binding protein aMBF1 (putative translation factor)
MFKQQKVSMASCEICGIQILEKVDRVYVEGNLLTVCKSCSKRGKPSSKQQNIQKTGRPSSYQQISKKQADHQVTNKISKKQVFLGQRK